MAPPLLAVLLLPWACQGPAAHEAGVDGSSPPYVEREGPPPFGGTLFIDPDVITADDPTTSEGLTDAGRGSRRMFDRRVDGWIVVEAFLFDASYDDGLAIEVQVNPEFEGPAAAREVAARYAEVIGRLPTALRRDVETVWIHQGDELFGGGNDNLLIHVGQAERYAADGLLEEAFIHEAAHTSLDADHAAAPAWQAAQVADGAFVSRYARDHPEREDVAESFLPWLAVTHRPERISDELARTIRETIPHRLVYFGRQQLDLHPLE